jgi:hypothetical protein
MENGSIVKDGGHLTYHLRPTNETRYTLSVDSKLWTASCGHYTLAKGLSVQSARGF